MCNNNQEFRIDSLVWMDVLPSDAIGHFELRSANQSIKAKQAATNTHTHTVHTLERKSKGEDDWIMQTGAERSSASVALTFWSEEETGSGRLSSPSHFQIERAEKPPVGRQESLTISRKERLERATEKSRQITSSVESHFRCRFTVSNAKKSARFLPAWPFPPDWKRLAVKPDGREKRRVPHKSDRWWSPTGSVLRRWRNEERQIQSERQKKIRRVVKEWPRGGRTFEGHHTLSHTELQRVWKVEREREIECFWSLHQVQCCHSHAAPCLSALSIPTSCSFWSILTEKNDEMILK